jgi:murein DD-endopeptidase MepM/ murein hydrolase activator NlpD
VTTRRARPHRRDGFRQRGKLLLVRLFPERQFVLRTGMRRRCFTLSTSVQAAVTSVALGTAIWQGVVTAEWLDSAITIARKNHEIVELRVDREAAIDSKSSTEKRIRALATRIAAEIEDIDSNLALLARHDVMTSKPVAAYSASSGDSASEQAGGSLGRSVDDKLARLEETLRVLQAGHDELLTTSAQTASAQLGRLEGALATVGINTGALVADVVQRENGSTAETDACARAETGRGGPFVPVNMATAASAEDLRATMRRWDDLVVAMSNLPLGVPVENMRVSSSFGRRRDPINRRQAMHAGIDYAGLVHAPVLATGGGVVSYSDRNGRYGKMVEIDHGHGFFTRYAHLAEISVMIGQEVERGTQLGLVGSTGRSTGPHLHYELRVGNEPRDPLKYIGVGKNVFQRNSSEGRKG